MALSDQEEPLVDDEADQASLEPDPVGEFDIVSSPNDFNTKTLVSFIEGGRFIVPGFQRNYVWDISRASRLIESVVLGLPVPQVFLYEEAKNRFLVVDGQQRLLSLYFFAKKRFPRKEVRPELRTIIDRNGGRMPDSLLEDDKFFQRFNLRLPSNLPDEKNPLHGLNHATLGERADTYDFRTIRSIVIKQLAPEGDASVFEIFNRLNTGGLNLRPQEMRSSIYHSAFFSSVHRLNALRSWRVLLGVEYPDIRMKDSEVLLRALAMLVSSDSYKPSMVRFLNQFAKTSRDADSSEIQLREHVVTEFLDKAAAVGPELFQLQSQKLSVPFFEAVLHACCRAAYVQKDPGSVKGIDKGKVQALKQHPELIKSISSNSADTVNVKLRLRLAGELL